MEYWKKRNEDWTDKSPDIEIIDHDEYVDISDEGGKFLYSRARDLYSSKFHKLSKLEFLKLIEILELFTLHPERIIEFREVLEFLEDKGVDFIRKAINREEKLRENCHRGGRKGKVWYYVAYIKQCPEKKYDLIEEAKQNLSRASIFRILKETKDIPIKEPNFEERITRIKSHPDYLALCLSDSHRIRLEHVNKIAFDRQLS